MESTVNEIIGKLVVPNQQMRWSPHGDIAAEFYTAAALGLLVWWIEHDFCHDDAWLTGLYRKLAEQSRLRILDAATEVATERGYDGTTISLVSKKSGLPPSGGSPHSSCPAGRPPGRWRSSWGRTWPRRCWTRLISCASG